MPLSLLVRVKLQGSGWLYCSQVEKAGGYSSADGKQISSLDVPIEAYDQRTQVWLLFG